MQSKYFIRNSSFYSALEHLFASVRGFETYRYIPVFPASESVLHLLNRHHETTTFVYKRQRLHSHRPLSDKVRSIIIDAKRRHRTDIDPNAWDRDNLANSDLCKQIIPSQSSQPIQSIHCRDFSVKQFIRDFEKPYVPLLIQGIPEQDKWNATRRWTIKRIYKKYKNASLKCGEDDNEKSIRVKLKHFIKYLKNQTDDSPLYVFDCTFDESNATMSLLEDYSVPKYFRQDLFHLIGEKRRPPYRWFLIGPKRSGSCVHIDPLGTSAWNSLLFGIKRWVLFPPHLRKSVVTGKDLVKPGEDDEAIHYFAFILPRMKAMHGMSKLQCLEFMQYPGDTVFVPGGWWHAVVNVTDTIAVTQNFCSKQNFDSVWRKTRKGRKRLAKKWLLKLQETYPQLATRALAIDSEK